MAYNTFYTNSVYHNSNHGWQVRVHIAEKHINTDPSNPNNRVKDIQRIIGDIFKDQPVDLKMYEIGTNEDVQGYNGVLSHIGSDRTQVGKEVCIYLPNADVKQLSADEYKEKLLLVWKALQDAGIELTYQNIPGDQSITTYGGSPTPFSFTSENPDREEWKDDHGILFKQFKAHGNHPILNVNFGVGEINTHGIRYNNDELQSTVGFLTEQKAKAYKDVQDQIDDINKEKIEYRSTLFDDTFTKKYIKDLAKHFREKEIHQRDARELLLADPNYQSLANGYPHARDSKFTLHIDLDELTNATLKLTDERIDTIIDRLRADYDKSLKEIKDDLVKINFQSLYPGANLDQLIAKNPAKMQSIFRQLALLQQEEQLNVYDNSDQIKEFNDPKIRQLIQYKQDRKVKSPSQYLGFFGSLGRLFGAYSMKEKYDAVDALINCFSSSEITLDRKHIGPLQQGNLGQLLEKLNIDPKKFIQQGPALAK